METETGTPRRQRIKLQERVKTPLELREHVYQVWLYECSRSFKLTAQAFDCNPRTIERWAKRHNWQERARNELGAIMPDVVFQTAANLRMTAFQASQKLERMARLANMDGTPFDAKEADALLKMVDRGGFSPVGQNQPSLPNAPAKLHDGTEPATIDDLLARHRDRLNG